MTNCQALHLQDVKLITPGKFSDARGFFSETYNRRAYEAFGITGEFVQDNHSRSAVRGTVRGIHFQAPPFGQDKLVRVARGSILDVAVDLRKGSPTFGQHAAVELSAENWLQLFIPIGFGHAFCTLEPDTEVVYKVTDYYAPAADGGILWNDPAIGIAWPSFAGALVSGKDSALPLLKNLANPFI